MSKRPILIAALGLVIGTAVTVAATFFVIKRLVTVKDDPMDRAGGIKPSQKLSERSEAALTCFGRLRWQPWSFWAFSTSVSIFQPERGTRPPN
jgi:hypothetical protein